jgi:hypothetical protein
MYNEKTRPGRKAGWGWAVQTPGFSTSGAPVRRSFSDALGFPGVVLVVVVHRFGRTGAGDFPLDDGLGVLRKVRIPGQEVELHGVIPLTHHFMVDSAVWRVGIS